MVRSYPYGTSFVASAALLLAGLAALPSDRATAQEAGIDPALPAFEFRREGAKSPEEAAEALYRASALESPRHFVQHLLLGACDGPVATLGKFAEHLHRAKFHAGNGAYSVYDLPRPIDREKPVRAVASLEFDESDKRVAALQLESVSTYYGETFRCVDVVGESYDGREYRMRIVVAQVQGRWYATPRCRSSNSFYAIADAMPLPAVDAS